MEGRRFGRRLLLEEFSIPNGLHGMQVWFGDVEMRGVFTGIMDRNSDAFYPIDCEASRAFAGQMGTPVLVEGYVDQDKRVKVLYWRLLREPVMEP